MGSPSAINGNSDVPCGNVDVVKPSPSQKDGNVAVAKDVAEDFVDRLARAARLKGRNRSVRELVHDFFRARRKKLPTVPRFPEPPDFGSFSEEENAVIRSVLERNMALVEKVLLTERKLQDKLQELEDTVDGPPQDDAEVCHHCQNLRMCDRVTQMAYWRAEKIWLCEQCQLLRKQQALTGRWFHDTDTNYDTSLAKDLLGKVSQVLHIGSYEGFEEVLGTQSPVGQIQVRLLYDEGHNLLFVSVLQCKDLIFSLDTSQECSLMTAQAFLMCPIETSACRHTAPRHVDLTTRPCFEQVFVWTDLTDVQLEESILRLSVWLTSPRRLIGVTEVPMKILAVNDQEFWLQLFASSSEKVIFEEDHDPSWGCSRKSRPADFSKSIRKLFKGRIEQNSESELECEEEESEDYNDDLPRRDSVKVIEPQEEDDASKYLSASWEVISAPSKLKEFRQSTRRRNAVLERRYAKRIDPCDLKESLQFVMRSTEKQIQKERKSAAARFYPAEECRESSSLMLPKSEKSKSLPRNAKALQGSDSSSTLPRVSLLELSKNFEEEVSPLENKKDYFAEEPISPEEQHRALQCFLSHSLPVTSFNTYQRNCISAMGRRSLEQHYDLRVSGKHSDFDTVYDSSSSAEETKGATLKANTDPHRPTVAQLIFPTIRRPPTDGDHSACLTAPNGVAEHSLAAVMSNGEVHLVLTLKGSTFRCHVTECRKLTSYEKKKSVHVHAIVVYNDGVEADVISSGKKLKSGGSKLSCRLASNGGVEGRVLESCKPSPELTHGNQTVIRIQLKQKYNTSCSDMYSLGEVVLKLDELPLISHKLVSGWYALHPDHHMLTGFPVSAERRITH